jgi:hypothetical protein
VSNRSNFKESIVPEQLQINFEYNSIEDRLLMRICEKESHGGCVEYRFWLTRRYADVFIKAIGKLIEDGLAGDMQVSPDAMEAMKKFQQESALARADFATSYDVDPENCTLIGEEPFLASILKVQKKSKNKYVFSLLTNTNEGMNITADIDLIHTLRKMLLASVDNAGWNQPLSSRTGEEVKAGEPFMRIS